MRNLAAPGRQHQKGLDIPLSGLAEAPQTHRILSTRMRIRLVTVHMGVDQTSRAVIPTHQCRQESSRFTLVVSDEGPETFSQVMMNCTLRSVARIQFSCQDKGYHIEEILLVLQSQDKRLPQSQQQPGLHYGCVTYTKMSPVVGPFRKLAAVSFKTLETGILSLVCKRHII